MFSIKMRILRLGAAVLDVVSLPFILIGGVVMKWLKKAEIRHFPLARKLLIRIGIWPIQDHYYEPLFNPKHLRCSLREDRYLPGVDLQEDKQLLLLESLNYKDELSEFPVEGKADGEVTFFYNNFSYVYGDAEILYSMVRKNKPNRIIEIGSGYSSLMIQNAIETNKKEDDRYNCEHICIEPYEMPWLEKKPMTVVRKKLEEVSRDLFLQLEENDILFIDSSHIIRPQGDVLVEYLEILPILKKGVIVHIHDIFTPKDYLDSWVYDGVKLWNEQYLLEAFLYGNKYYEVMFASNYMRHHHYDLMKEHFPMLDKQPIPEPGSFWMRKVE